MIRIEKEEITGLNAAIRGMRNPLNSWAKSDSEVRFEDGETYYHVGVYDLDLMKRLVKAGSDHAKFRRMITVYADVVAPLYWWKEYDTYKVGTVANSCSTMHTIQNKLFTMDDFSHEHLLDENSYLNWGDRVPTVILEIVIQALNQYRACYLQTKDKTYWWQMIQLLPSSYNQRRTVQLNYEVLANIYRSRKGHKLDEWRSFCYWIEQLPYSEFITGEA